MRIIYNNTELQHNTKSYTTLINKPSLNGKLLQGNVSLDTLSLYDKPAVEKLVESVSQIRLVTTMPADPEPSMTYYVGPDERDLYDVILVNDAKQQIPMGTTQFGQYKSGQGVNVKVDNTININTDDVSVYIDSEGNIASSLDGEALPAFVGATSSAAGQKGLAPKPLAGQQNALLKGDSSWIDIIDYIYPVGALLLTDNNNNPNTIYSGTTWELLDSGYALLNTEAGGGVKVDSVGIPDVKGRMTVRPRAYVNTASNPDVATDAFTYYTSGQELGNTGILGGGAGMGYYIGMGNIRFTVKASQYNSSTTAYGKSNSVQPPAITVYAWRRTA